MSKGSEKFKLTEARGKIYGFLSSIYLQTPNQDFVERLLNEGYKSFLNSLASDLADSNALNELKDGLETIKNFIGSSRNKPKEELREDLGVVYTRFFRGVKQGYSPPLPCESVYREGRIMGNSTLEVLRKYREAHVSLLDQYKREPPDGIGFELNFMHFLCSKEVEAWRSANRDDALKWLYKEKEFLEDHILQWIPEFCTTVEKLCKDIGRGASFYLGVVKMTKSFLDLDYKIVCAIINAGERT